MAVVVAAHVAAVVGTNESGSDAIFHDIRYGRNDRGVVVGGKYRFGSESGRVECMACSWL